MTAEDTLDIPVLFCSQTGNASDAAENLAEKIPEYLSTPTTKITSHAVTLDDFLDVELRKTQAQMPTIFCVVCSSYGVGQAPLGGYKFRELCDYIISSQDKDKGTVSDGNRVSTLWEGCRYAMLGLGDSKYITYFGNPTALDGGLSKAGALRIGKLGKADVSGTDKQANVIERWSKDIISDLALVLKEREAAKNTEGDGYCSRVRQSQERMAAKTVEICRNVFDDWDEGQEILKKQEKGMLLRIFAAILYKTGPIGLIFIVVQLLFGLLLFLMPNTNGNKDTLTSEL